MPESLVSVVQNSTTAHDAVRGLAVASTCRELPVQAVGEILESLAGMNYGLPKVIENLGESLIFFLAAEFHIDVNEGDDPREPIALAQGHLHQAASLAVQLGNELSKAKDAISSLESEEPWF